MGKTLTGYTDAVIFAGGYILNYEAVASKIKSGSLIICADSGYRHCEKLGIKPDILVGDFDSIEYIPNDLYKISLSVDKNYTDSALAVEEAIHRGAKSILLAGMLGGRFDHSMANIQTMVSCINRNIAAYITDGNTDLYAVKALEDSETFFTLPYRDNCYFSLLAYTPVCNNVTILNGKYPLDDYDLHFDEARAVSNEFVDDDVRVCFSSGILLISSLLKDTK